MFGRLTGADGKGRRVSIFFFWGLCRQVCADGSNRTTSDLFFLLHPDYLLLQRPPIIGKRKPPAAQLLPISAGGHVSSVSLSTPFRQEAKQSEKHVENDSAQLWRLNCPHSSTGGSVGFFLGCAAEFTPNIGNGGGNRRPWESTSSKHVDRQ